MKEQEGMEKINENKKDSDSDGKKSELYVKSIFGESSNSKWEKQLLSISSNKI